MKILIFKIKNQDFLFFREKQSSSNNHREKELLQSNVRQLV